MKTLIPLTLTAFLALGCTSNENRENSKQENSAKKVSNIFTNDSSKRAFSHAQDFESYELEDLHILGKSFFTKPWVEAPASTTARDGLGPLFSANTCLHCHPNNGRGVNIDESANITRSLVMRLSLKNSSNINNALTMTNGFLPEPTYGGQFSLNGNSNTPYEGTIKVTYSKIIGEYDDGEMYELQTPSYTLDDLQYGALHKDVNIAGHIGLSLVGLGALEMIEEKVILANEDVEDRDGDGISGKANWVYNPETNATELGRFTHKAAAASVKQQSANAAHNDMGLSNPLYRGDNCTKSQKECLDAPKGNDAFDLPMERLDAIAFYLKTLKIPAQRESAAFTKGEVIFNDLGCVKCHISSYELADGTTIHPYSDLLLHDMGEGLADGHRAFKASENEFRTPPLWGLGLYEKTAGRFALLHDGRARTIEEAILWHGGEAQKTKEKFKALNKAQREDLIAFLKGI